MPALPGTRETPIVRPTTPSSSWFASLDLRLAWVARFRVLVATRVQELLALERDEIHKSAWEAFSSDVLPLLSACRWHERHARAVLKTQGLGRRPAWMLGQKTRVARVPLGRVAIIATWNYPVQLLGIQLVQALVAGNRVDVKPSERSPRTQALLLRIAMDAGLPEGVLTVHESTREGGARMLSQAAATGGFDHIVFTGSTSVGRSIAEHAAGTLTPTTLELSGRDSAIVLQDADASLAARCIWAGVTMNAGQTCMAPRRALVHVDVYARFLAALAPLVSGARPVMLIDDAAAERGFGLARAAMASGGRSLSGVAEKPIGNALRPLAIVDCPIGCDLFRGDHFSPMLAVVPIHSIESAIALHATCEQHLATSVFTRDLRAARALAGGLGAGSVTINDVIIPTAQPAASIAGRGMSGWGTSRGREGLLAMTRAVSISETSTRLRLPPEAPERGIAERMTKALVWWYGGRGTPASAQQVGQPSAERNG